MDQSGIASVALEMIQDGFVLGLGSGRAARAFVEALGTRIASGLKIRGVPTSRQTADLATSLGIPLVDFHEIDSIDLAIDGADEVDPELNLIKGLGGALVREKIVAAAARKFVILVGTEKLVGQLGERQKLPVEVVPFGWEVCQKKLRHLGLESERRSSAGQAFITDNGNYILDCQVGPLVDPQALEIELKCIPGVVGTGLFLGMADVVLIQHPDRVESRAKSAS
ncbi:MAG: ribose-5-phosphate isomerase RpiA [Planctomycetes bacterium]|nr:ribose-5-phosphate isomerase RpiA [Planctomycetota bacterium]